MTEKTQNPSPSVAAVKLRRAESAEAQASAPTSEATAAEETAAASPAPRRVFDPGKARAAEAALDTPAAAQAEAEARLEKEANEAATLAQDEEDFSALFEAQGAPPPVFVQVGQSVQGTLIEIGQDYAFIDLGGKAEATIEKAELLDEHGELTLQVGDSLRATVIEMRRGEIRLGTKIARGAAAATDAIASAFDAELPVEGRVTGLNKGGYEVDVMGLRGFCPLSQIELAYTEDPELHLERSYTFRIIEFGERGRKLVLSRAALLREEAEVQAEVTRETLAVGVVFDGTVRSIREFGAFVDIGGLDGLVHISEISHQHIKSPHEVLSEGQQVKVEVLSIEAGERGERISLSIKRTENDPWSTVHEWLKTGEVYTGLVVRLAPFGAFIELRPGIEGLAHISELSWERRIHHPQDVLKEGERVDVAVLNVDAETRRISLSLKAAHGDPWEDVAERFPKGSAFEGVVESVVDFGLFVRLEPGIVGLVHASETGTPQGTQLVREFKIDQAVRCAVLDIDEERQRINLSIKALDESAPRESEPSTQREGGRRRPGGGGGRQRPDSGGGGGARQHREAGTNFATFGDLLKNKLNKKD